MITDELVERVAHALWLSEAERAAPNVARSRTLAAFRESLRDDERDKWLGSARAALSASGLEALQARVEVLTGLVERARENVPEHYVNWHHAAAQTLISLPDVLDDWARFVAEQRDPEVSADRLEVSMGIDARKLKDRIHKLGLWKKGLA